MCGTSQKRKVLRKTSGTRSDGTSWYGVVLEEKSNTIKDPDDPKKEIVNLYPQKMQFINSEETFNSLSEGQVINVND